MVKIRSDTITRLPLHDDAMFRRSLSIDPYDWRMVDSYAEFLLRTGRDDEWPAYAERSLMVQPRSGVKSMLTKGKSLVWLGKAGEACDSYDLWWKEHEEDRKMPLLMNNVALCMLRTLGNREEAKTLMQDAFDFATAEDHKEKLGRNLALLNDWKDGSYTGSLLW